MLIRKELFSNGALMGIWKIDETLKELINLFPYEIRAEVEESIKNIGSDRRVLELLSTRIMLIEMLNEVKVILNHEDGKPYLSDNSYNISISHTKDYVAVLLHSTHPVGIDIETISERVENVATRFISEKEYIDPTQKITHQLLHWSTKECLFKLINEQGIDFLEHLHVKPFTPSIKGEIEALETRTKESQSFKLNYEVHPSYILTWVVDNMGAKNMGR